MSDKLSSEHRRALEILLEPGIKELLKERSRKAFNRVKLKEWIEAGEPYEEIDEILGTYNYFANKLEHLQTSIYRTSLEFPDGAHKNGVSSIKRESEGTVKHNSDNERGNDSENVFRLYPSNAPLPRKHCSPSASTRNTTTRTTYKNCEHSGKSSGQSSIPNTVNACKLHAYSTQSIESSEQIYQACDGSEDQKL
ncbi:hypothetical protein C1645_818947 [Glomus cerebriforme]|uniref:Uncharacterized protein n=1 Tax=Glomus cerebriforme TaxID=658196 RepID=A0A397TFJ1_9GLOM|nr:hypothetical protein C1645_818947 [Glomus cerebriforme]